MNFKYIILIIVLLLIIEHQPLSFGLAEEPIKMTNSEDLQKIYRCCNSKCYLVESYTRQYNVIREVSREEVYRSEDQLIFNSGYCPKELIIN